MNARILSTLLLVYLASFLTSCPDSSSTFRPNVNSLTIGASGGTVKSADDCFEVTIPAGALAAPTVIRIEEFQDRTYRFGQDVPLQAPATIRYTVKGGAWLGCRVLRLRETQKDGTIRATSQTVDVTLDSSGSATNWTITTTIPTIDSDSSFIPVTPADAFKVTVDPSVLSQGLVEGLLPTFVQTNVDAVASSSLILPASLEWSVDSFQYTVQQLTNDPFPAAPTVVPFAPGQSDPYHRDDIFLLSCDPGQPSVGTFRVTVVSQDFYGPGASVTLNCKFPVFCTHPGGSTGGASLPPNAVYHALGGFLHSVESVLAFAASGSSPRLPAGSESAAAAPPNLELIVAGQPLGGTGKSILRFDGVTGAVLQQEDYADSPGTPFPGAAFDAYILQSSPSGAQNGAISLSGQTRFLVELDASGNPLAFGQFSFGFFAHSPLIANDPTLGVVFTNDLSPTTLTPTLSLYQPDPSTGGWILNEDVVELTSALRSVAANATATEFVGLRTSGGLVWIEAPSGGPVTETLIAMTPAHHGRIAWDPASGIGAFSDFVDSTVTAFSWAADGTPPAILDTANVGDGPVGISVLGHRIASAGFNDDTLTRMELDPVTGLFTMVDILPNPFAADGAEAPGHITLVTPEAAAVSYNVSNGVGVLPHFYASAP
ncbi:MAG TPA: hypothetical protein ENJ09_04585 [Planctomycetes bacterium]|nr:hypothetical protein [Planctomycetota bacterium]